MPDPRDYKLEITGITPGSDEAARGTVMPSTAPRSATGGTGGTGDRVSSRPFLQVRFACCDIYCRIYRNREQTAYVGRCPKCAKPVTFRIGPGGTDHRAFIVY